jgi:transposase-like protein
MIHIATRMQTSSDRRSTARGDQATTSLCVARRLAERGIEVDHVTVFRWVQCFTPLLIDEARPCRHAPGDRWFADETYVKATGR